MGPLLHNNSKQQPPAWATLRASRQIAPLRRHLVRRPLRGQHNSAAVDESVTALAATLFFSQRLGGGKARVHGRRSGPLLRLHPLEAAPDHLGQRLHEAVQPHLHRCPQDRLRASLLHQRTHRRTERGEYVLAPIFF